MDILRKHLDRACSAAVKEIQQVPSGLAIWPKDGLGLQLLTERREHLERLIQGATAEVEQKWAIFALPNAPQQYTSYDGTQVPITEQMALDEFKLQTGLSPLKFYFSNKNPLSSTLIMTVPEDQARAVPKWTNLFGKNVQAKQKPFRARIEQCTRCWDYHNPGPAPVHPGAEFAARGTTLKRPIPLPMTMRPQTHAVPIAVDLSQQTTLTAPPGLPYSREPSNGLTKSQLIAVRKAGACQHMLQDQTATTEPSRSLGSSPTREQPQAC